MYPGLSRSWTLNSNVRMGGYRSGLCKSSSQHILFFFPLHLSCSKRLSRIGAKADWIRLDWTGLNRTDLKSEIGFVTLSTAATRFKNRKRTTRKESESREAVQATESLPLIVTPMEPRA